MSVKFGVTNTISINNPNIEHHNTIHSSLTIPVSVSISNRLPDKKLSSLIVISSKSPNPYLYECIDKLYKIQIKNKIREKICIIDSDSDDLTNYIKIKNAFPFVEIYFIKNKNYEYGAWKYAYSIYPNYDIYIFLQDSIIINKKIPFNIIDDYNAYIFHNYEGYESHLSIKDAGINNIKNSGLNYSDIVDKSFCVAQHNSFIVNNYMIKNILETLQIPPINKDGSCFFERNFGLYFILKNIKTHDLYNFFDKYHGNRN